MHHDKVTSYEKKQRIRYLVCLCSRVVTVLAWTVAGLGFKPWCGYLSILAWSRINFLGRHGGSFTNFRGTLQVGLASMPVGLVSRMDRLMMVICHSRRTLPYGAVGSCSADHAEAVPLQLYRGAWPGWATITQCCKLQQGSSIPPPFPYTTPWSTLTHLVKRSSGHHTHINTPGKLGHQVTYCTHHTGLNICSIEVMQWAKSHREASALVYLQQGCHPIWALFRTSIS